MVVARRFEPLRRLSLSATTGGAAWRSGPVQAAQGHGALVIGAVLGGLLLSLGRTSLPTGSRSLGPRTGQCRSGMRQSGRSHHSAFPSTAGQRRA